MSKDIITSSSDEFFMQRALELAQQAAAQGEVPVGAVLVKEDRIIAEGWNAPISQCDATAHAEIQALRTAGRCLNNYRLPKTSLYVTLEPCIMCAGALIHARIERLIFGAFDVKAGAISQGFDLFNHPAMNHHIEWQGGVLETECSFLLSHFFQQRRIEQKSIKKEKASWG